MTAHKKNQIAIKTMAIQKLSLRNKLAFFISVISFFFFVPGIYLSVISVSTSGTVTAKIPHIESNFWGMPSVHGTEKHKMALNIFDTSRSILKTTHDLWQRDYFFVASMIFLFSVVVPLLKGVLLLYVFFHQSAAWRNKIFAFIKSIGKWSMCDVFLAAIFLTFMSTGATSATNSKNIAVMSYPIHVDVLTGMHAELHIGFWCFLTYCILALIALQLYKSY